MKLSKTFQPAILIIGQTFPEPTTTAAGRRMMQLLNFFSEEGYKIHFASTASISDKSADLNTLNISVEYIKVNDQGFDTYLKGLNPNIVLFDRFITEEQFGWRVSEICPTAIRILDTEDLHFLRKAREVVIKEDGDVNNAFLFTDTAKREIASILRSDLSLIISTFEMDLLQNTFRIYSEILLYLPFLIEIPTAKEFQDLQSFDQRKDFVAIGNLLHAPNVDSVEILKKEIWPIIRKQLPSAKLNVYGAYAPQRILQLHNEKEGFIIKGWAENLESVLQKAKICLAPLQFGAGLKGKLFDSVLNGCPFVTTKIGAEGMFYSEENFIVNNFEAFAQMAVSMYTTQENWEITQRLQRKAIVDNFKKAGFLDMFNEQIIFLQNNIEKHRQDNFIGQILQHKTVQSTKYLSKWIEAKNS